MKSHMALYTYAMSLPTGNPLSMEEYARWVWYGALGLQRVDTAATLLIAILEL
jgi:hypothetical protein